MPGPKSPPTAIFPLSRYPPPGFSMAGAGERAHRPGSLRLGGRGGDRSVARHHAELGGPPKGLGAAGGGGGGAVGRLGAVTPRWGEVRLACVCLFAAGAGCCSERLNRPLLRAMNQRSLPSYKKGTDTTLLLCNALRPTRAHARRYIGESFLEPPAASRQRSDLARASISEAEEFFEMKQGPL